MTSEIFKEYETRKNRESLCILSVERVQDLARDHIGRDLTESEIHIVKKEIEWLLDSWYWPEIVMDFIDDAVESAKLCDNDP